MNIKEKQKRKIRRLHNNGLTVEEIAKEVPPLSPSEVAKILRSLGLTPRYDSPKM